MFGIFPSFVKVDRTEIYTHRPLTPGWNWGWRRDRNITTGQPMNDGCLWLGPMVVEVSWRVRERGFELSPGGLSLLRIA